MLVLYPDSAGRVSSVLRPFWFVDCGSAWVLVALLIVPVVGPAIAARKLK